MFITALVVSFLVCCRLDVGCGWAGVVSRLHSSLDTTPAYRHLTSNLQQTKKETTRLAVSAAGQGSGGTYRKSLLELKLCWLVTNIDDSRLTHIVISSVCMERQCREQETELLQNRDKITGEVLPLGCAGKLVGGEALHTRHQACSPHVKNLHSETRTNAVNAQCAAWPFRGEPSSGHATATAASTDMRLITTFR